MYHPLKLSTIEKTIRTQQSSGAPLPLRSLLANEVRTALCLYKSGNARMKASGRRRFLDAREQLRILDAIHYGYIRRAVKGG